MMAKGSKYGEGEHGCSSASVLLTRPVRPIVPLFSLPVHASFAFTSAVQLWTVLSVLCVMTWLSLPLIFKAVERL